MLTITRKSFMQDQGKRAEHPVNPEGWAMRLVKFSIASDPTPRVGLLEGEQVIPIGSGSNCLSAILHAENLPHKIQQLRAAADPRLALASVQLQAPLDLQEVWGAGVTYERSKQAREEESEAGASFYDQVYRAPRPELFLKATPSRVVGPGQAIRVRADSRWCVPEPELALVISPGFDLVGFTIGNDVSARDIEGENPLYLPQAKVYDACCALGPAITLATCHAITGGHNHPSRDRAKFLDSVARIDVSSSDGPRVRRADSMARSRQSFPGWRDSA